MATRAFVTISFEFMGTPTQAQMMKGLQVHYQGQIMNAKVVDMKPASAVMLIHATKPILEPVRDLDIIDAAN